jgi:glycosyltransferase involved in cell wall biosynthesis
MVLNPLISILLPVYNAEKYLKESIESILHQTYKNLELIIINDGSIDDSKNIIKSYNDQRIIYIENKNNKGLIHSLNEGIEISKGEYIARMDSDDISFPERIEYQLQFLIENPTIGIVGTHAVFFTESSDKPIKNWNLDLKTNQPSEIRNTLKWENCIIHPSICMRKSIAKDLLYDETQKNYEDYDLWLRASAMNIEIGKINQPLLYYRVQPNSITQKMIRNNNFYIQIAAVKYRFFKRSLLEGKLNNYTLSVLLIILYDLLMGLGKYIKSIKIQ